MRSWPAELRGQELINTLVLIDRGSESEEDFQIDYETAVADGEVEAWFSQTTENTVGYLRLVEVEKLRMPEEGVADPELVAEYAESMAELWPLIVVGCELRDGYHRVDVARLRGETHLWAYVIEGAKN